MTDVLRSNYEELIPKIIKKIETCSFVAIDAEYTGLFTTNSENLNSLFDFPADRYKKLRATFPNYLISQFGLSIFEKEWDENFYHVETYNIYLYPVSFDEFNNRRGFELQISSCNFLSSNNFDYNKFIREGVPYLTEKDAGELRKYLRSNPCFMKYMEVRDKGYFPTYNPSIESDEDIEDIVDRLTGFTKIMTAIQKLEKPIIGHNMLMDIILLHQQFYGELPESYEVFKTKVHSYFPTIFDTKHVAAAMKRTIALEHPANTRDVEALYDTNLFALYHKTHTVRDLQTPFFVLRDGSTNYQKDLDSGLVENLERGRGITPNSTHCHEAGFDACVTGAVFVRLAYIFARHNARNVSVKIPCLLTVTETFSAVNRWKNQVNISRAVVNNINFYDGSDVSPCRPNWIRVDSGPESKGVLNVPQLRSMLSRFGDLEIEVIDSRSILLAFGGWGGARKACKLLESQGFILSIQDFQHISKMGTSYSRSATVLALSLTVVGILFWSFKRS